MSYIASRDAGRTFGREKKSRVERSADPAARAIKDGTFDLSERAWKQLHELTEVIKIDGGHVVTSVTIGVKRVGSRVVVRFINGTPCEKIARRSVREGDRLVAGLAQLVVVKELGVKTSKLKGSLRHNAEVFAKALLEKIYKIETSRPRRSAPVGSLRPPKTRSE